MSTTATPAEPSGRPSVTEAAAPGGSSAGPGGPSAAGHFGVVVGRFYEELAARLVAGVQRAFDEAGVTFEVHEVPGAYELPLAALYLAHSGRIDGVACLGAVIRGETDHYDYVCNEAARGIQDVQLRTGVPCAFGVLTVETMEQALARSGGDHRDTGYHAGQVVLRMAALRAELA
jgi:6,7-dimethyl-8-ribityllumazine synthase